MPAKEKSDKATPANRELRASLLVTRVVESYEAEKRISHLNSTFLPNRGSTIHVIELIRRLIFPGLFEEQKLKPETIHYHVGDLVDKIREGLYEQVRQTLRYQANQRRGDGKGDSGERCDEEADRVTQAFLERIPELRRLLSLDVKAGYDGDPAAESTDEIIFCYPGLDAIFTHRVAHELHKLGVPLLPRIMAEYAHNETGIDIHPGATIGESFFIDHGTGLVIGETTVIGNRVRIYQGVTLGALTTKMVEALRKRKRHPTIEDDVTIYPNATILGGETVIGKGATVNGGVFVTRSVPAGHTVSAEPPVLKLKPPKEKRGDVERPPDFQV
jgi:serine O-acetyltransferase